MIRKSKLLLPHIGCSAILRTNRKFTTLKKDIDELRQRSYIAQIIMRQIEKQRTFAEIKEQSLTDHLIRTVEKQSHIDPQVRNEMLKFFKQGITPNFQIFGQVRHEMEIFNLQIQKNPTKRLKLQETKIRFFPTTLISGQVFSELRIGLKKYQIITGHTGISKSLSVQLFWYLSNIVCEYRCKETSEEKLKQNTILEQIPKLIYWNIVPTQNPQITRRKILKQCFQIGNDLENSNYLRKESTKFLMDFYNKHKTKVILLSDQFNLMVNIVREIQNLSFQQLNSDEQLKQLKQNMFKSLLNIRRQQFSRYLYLSSVLLEKQHLKKFHINRHMGKMAPIQYHRIKFQNLLSTPMALYEFIDYFMFELKQKFQIPGYQSKIYNNQKIKSKIRKQIFNQIRQIKSQIYLTPFLISQKLRQNIDIQKLQSLLQMDIGEEKIIESLTSQLKKIFLLCLDSNQQKFIENLKDFLNKDLDNQKAKVSILAQMFIQQQGKIKRKKREQQILNFQRKKLKQQKYIIISQKVQTLDTQLNTQLIRTYKQEPQFKFEMDISKLISSNDLTKLKNLDNTKNLSVQNSIDRRLFYYHNDGKIISSYFPYSTIKKYIGQYHKKVIQFMLSFSEDKISQLIDQTQYGNYFEKLFLEALTSGIVDIRFPNVKLRFQNLYQKRIGFRPISRLQVLKDQSIKGNNYQFLKNFIALLQMLPDKYEAFTFVPLKQKFQALHFLRRNRNIELDEIDFLNPSVDLIFVKKIPQAQDRIIFTLIDVTVSRSTSKIKDKIFKFLQKYRFFKDQKNEIPLCIGNKIKNYPVQIRYYVISPIRFDVEKFHLFKKSIKQSSKNIFNCQIFQEQSEVDQLKVSKQKLLTNGLSPLLSQIGHIYMGRQQMQLSQNFKQQNIPLDTFCFFDRFCKALEKFQSQQKNNLLQII